MDFPGTGITGSQALGQIAVAGFKHRTVLRNLVLTLPAILASRQNSGQCSAVHADILAAFVLGDDRLQHDEGETGGNVFVDLPGGHRQLPRRLAPRVSQFKARILSGQFDPIIADAGRAHGVSPDLVHAVIRAESSYDQYAKSSKGARGLMQLMPATARRFGVMDSYNPRQNIFAGVQYLRILLDMFRGDVSLALAGYNAGENAVKRHGGIPPYKETQRYVRKIRSWLGSGRPASYSYVPRGPVQASNRTTGSKKLEPAQPGIYYKFVDGKGVLHVTNKRPPEGVTYSMIRALK